ncbi:unnamed protein product [Brachionus calyciflorus]|uniref:Small ribosomal subunit protein mS35 mitochondrial conserved domain-containing protein n=1 Tax=Brachionus calyciflorus TaxID=104777 RepID=A0A813N2T2_9BILA|nr:unnamed protein product [Brachionus calyciflorus]
MSLVSKFSRAQSSIFTINTCVVNTFFSSHLNTKFYSTESAENADERPAKKERVFFREQDEVDGFKVFDVYMNKKKDERSFDQRVKRTYPRVQRDRFARYNRMPIDQDWTNVWPTASPFKQTAVPLPVRQGFVKNMIENDGLPPEKYANVELIKIPNFLHLTPPHIKKQCGAIKKFCTPWPKELKTDEDCEKNFPIEITTSTYIYDGPSVRDDRARVVKLQIKLSSLNLDKRSNDKLIKLAEDRYDPATDTLTLITDRCPYRRQNEDYANYLLTTLYYESKQCEDWESEITEDDMRTFEWEKSKSKENILNTIRNIEKIEDETQAVNLKQVKTYQNNLSKIFNEGETDTNILQYKQSVLNLLKIKTA